MSWVSEAVRCCIFIISIMNKSGFAGGLWIASTASAIDGVNCSASAALILVESEVRATERRSSRSTGFVILNVLRNLRVSFFAIS
jgi:hypothetical protein